MILTPSELFLLGWRECMKKMRLNSWNDGPGRYYEICFDDASEPTLEQVCDIIREHSPKPKIKEYDIG